MGPKQFLTFLFISCCWPQAYACLSLISRTASIVSFPPRLVVKWVSIPQPTAYYLHPKSGPLGIRGHANSSQRNGPRIKTQQTWVCHQALQSPTDPYSEIPDPLGRERNISSLYLFLWLKVISLLPPNLPSWSHLANCSWRAFVAILKITSGQVHPLPFAFLRASCLVARLLFFQDHSLGIASLVAIEYAVTLWFAELFFYF